MNLSPSRMIDALMHSGRVDLLLEGRMGLEKEGLRVGPNSKLAQTPHPSAFGAPLTHPYITTDFSEALLELITPAQHGVQPAIDFLTTLHQYINRNLDDEVVWGSSMPCLIYGETPIPLAQYGHSNPAQMKTIYRRGLGYRYGREMQVIAGIHFNYSFADKLWPFLQRLESDYQPLQQFINRRYFGVLRNLQRWGWLIPYLFGASPAICRSFVHESNHTLESYDKSTLFGPWATSLRMGDIGYQNNQANDIGVKACYDSIDEYIDTLRYAINTTYPGYKKLGLKVDGEYRQLNASILQIENEYYSTVRPKQPLSRNEMSIVALAKRGVQYTELRSVDINPFVDIGIGADQLRFLELLFFHALISDSPVISPWERAEVDKNEMLVAHQGRRPGLKLRKDGSDHLLRDWGEEICYAMQPIAAAMDQLTADGTPYCDALHQQLQVIENPNRTLSARVLDEMGSEGESHFQFVERRSRQYRDHFLSTPVKPDIMDKIESATTQSREDLQTLEAGDDVDFETFLARYFAQGEAEIAAIYPQ